MSSSPHNVPGRLVEDTIQWGVACADCRKSVVTYARSRSTAGVRLREHGWGERGCLWRCPRCLKTKWKGRRQ